MAQLTNTVKPLDPLAMGGAGPDAPVPGQPAQATATVVPGGPKTVNATAAPAATQGTDPTSSQSQVQTQGVRDTAPAAATATGIRALPDGSGGTVQVPPPGTTPEAPPPSSLPTFDSSSNLINTQIGPSNDPRTIGLQGQQDALLNKITSGPDRNAMAMDQYKTWEDATAPEFQHGITDATDAAAAHGQIGSGMLTNRYGDLSRQRVLDQTTARNAYMQDALGKSIGDRQTAFEDASSAAGTAYGQNVNSQNALRGERGYQSSKAEQALYNRIQQQMAEQSAQGQNFGQGLSTYGAGNTGDPTGAYQDASGQAGAEAQAAAGDTGALLRMLALQRAGAGQGLAPAA